MVRAGRRVEAAPMPDEQLSSLAEQQFGLVSATQLRQFGYPAAAFADRAAGTEWEALNDEVLRRRGAPAGRGQWALAAVLDAGSGSALSHSSAGSWWGVPGLLLRPLHVTRASRSRRRPGLVDELHTVRLLPTNYLTTLDGVPIVRPELLAMQLFAQFRYERAERHVDALWSMRLLSGRSLARLLIEQGARGRDGIGGVRRFLDERGEDYVPPASGLEGRAIKILDEVGIPMRRQVDSGGDQWDGRVDLRHLVEPLIVEIQSERYHAALSSRRDDEARRQQLERDGFVVVQVWDDEVWHRPHGMIDRVRDGAWAARARRLARTPSAAALPQ